MAAPGNSIVRGNRCRREVELLRSPINTLALERLLPTQPARTDSQWLITEEDARQVFNLEAVHKSSLEAKVTRIEKGLVTIELQGQLQATASSVPTELTIRGTVHAGLSSQCVIVTWLGLSIKEKREVSQLQPGFNLTARIQVIRQEQQDQVTSSRSQLLELAEADDPSRWLVRIESAAGRFALYAGRNWVTYLDGSEDSVLRMVEDNRVMRSAIFRNFLNLMLAPS